ncbi:hypothetical protein WJX79_004361 [Trebouxia sp. C0005]
MAKSGDIIFTGTPVGVGPVSNGQLAELTWGDKLGSLFEVWLQCSSWTSRQTSNEIEMVDVDDELSGKHEKQTQSNVDLLWRHLNVVELYLTCCMN